MIHYHGLPMWPKEAMVRALVKHHAMVSFEYPDQIEVAAEICQSIVADHGGFTAWQNGRVVDFPAYREWAAFWIRHPAVDWCVIPDVIDGTEHENDAHLDAWDLPPAVSVPVYHLHEPKERLGRLARTYPRVAIGSSGAFKDPGSPIWWERMQEVMPEAVDEEGFPLCKLHGLRQLNPVITSHVPYSSADSCNAALNIGKDTRWTGPYMPRSREVRAIVIMDRIESHATARRWLGSSAGVQENLELLG